MFKYVKLKEERVLFSLLTEPLWPVFAVMMTQAFLNKRKKLTAVANCTLASLLTKDTIWLWKLLVDPDLSAEENIQSESVPISVG